jgi:hypothetical protein
MSDVNSRGLEQLLQEVLAAGLRQEVAMSDLLAMMSLLNLMGIINLISGSGSGELAQISGQAEKKETGQTPDPSALMSLLGRLAGPEKPGPASSGTSQTHPD